MTTKISSIRRYVYASLAMLIAMAVLLPAGRAQATDGDPAIASSLSGPSDLVIAGGDIFIADTGNQRVRKVDSAGLITTVAGNGVRAFSGDGGLATAASLSSPNGIARDAAGNLYIADTGNHRIRKVGPTGTISTVAGNGFPSFIGDGGAATSAALNQPTDVTMAPDGGFYVADQANHRIRRVSPSGVITTFAGNGLPAFFGDGGPATQASLRNPRSVSVDDAGNLYIADLNNLRIRRVNLSGVISTVAGNGQTVFSGDGGPATMAGLSSPAGVAAIAPGGFYVAGAAHGRIRKVDAAGIITTVAGNGIAGYSGDGGPAVDASLTGPLGVGTSGNPNFYIADTFNHRVRKVPASGKIQTVAGNGIAGF